MDKVRFVYDSFYFSRLKSPKSVYHAQFSFLLKGKEIKEKINFLLSLSYLQAFDQIKKKVRGKKETTFLTCILGETLGHTILQSLKNFDLLNLFSITVSRYYSASLPKTIRNISSFLFNQNSFKSGKKFYFIGTNPRLLSPVFNSRMRKRALEQDVSVFFCGHTFLNYKYKVIGNTSYSFLRLLETLSTRDTMFFLDLKNQPEGIEQVIDKKFPLFFFTPLNFITGEINGFMTPIINRIRSVSQINLFFNVLLSSYVSGKNITNVMFQSHLPSTSLDSIDLLCPIESFFETSDEYRTLVGIKHSKHVLVPSGNMRTGRNTIKALIQYLTNKTIDIEISPLKEKEKVYFLTSQNKRKRRIILPLFHFSKFTRKYFCNQKDILSSHSRLLLLAQTKFMKKNHNFQS